MTRREITALGASIQQLMNNLTLQYDMLVSLAGILADEIERQPHDVSNQHTVSFLRTIVEQDRL